MPQASGEATVHSAWTQLQGLLGLPFLGGTMCCSMPMCLCCWSSLPILLVLVAILLGGWKGVCGCNRQFVANACSQKPARRSVHLCVPKLTFKASSSSSHLIVSATLLWGGRRDFRTAVTLRLYFCVLAAVRSPGLLALVSVTSLHLFLTLALPL